MTEIHDVILQMIKENPGIEEKLLFQKLVIEKFKLKDAVIPDNLTVEVDKLKNDFFKEISVMIGKEVTLCDEKYYIKQQPTVEQEEEIIIHPAGGVYKDFVIEPIENLNYVWKKADKKGISTAQPVFEDSQHKKRLLYWSIDINGKVYTFSDRPLKKLIYSIPSKQMIENWTEGIYNSKSASEIYKRQDTAVRVCLDLPLEHYYNVANLIVLESWLTEKLNVVFYGQIVGGFGGGKTAALEVLKDCSRHSSMAGNISSASLSRTVAKQKLTLFVDELDVKSAEADSETYMNIRQGYRRDNPYIRLNPNTMDTEVFETFGVKVFSLKSDIEKALKNRSLAINIGETDDSRLPIINAMKETLLKEIYNEWFFWFLDNIVNIRVVQLDVSQLDLTKPIEEIREQIYRTATQNFTDLEKEFLKEFRGRNVELGYIALMIAKAYGLDILENIKETFEEKQSAETEEDDGSWSSTLKELLKTKYEVAKSQGRDWIIHADIFRQFRDTILNETKRTVSAYAFAGMLRDLGFIDKVTKKRKSIDGRSTLCLIFDQKILRRLGLTDTTIIKEFVKTDEKTEVPKVTEVHDVPEDVKLSDSETVTEVTNVPEVTEDNHAGDDEKVT